MKDPNKVLLIVAKIILFLIVVWFIYQGVNDCLESSPARTALGRLSDCG